MASSRRYRLLLTRLEVLRRHFLPKDNEFSPTGHYTDRQHDLARAYVLLSHAEIEAFLEDISRARADKIKGRWLAKQCRSRSLRRLIQAHNVHGGRPWQPLDWSDDRVASALNFYFGLINQNNGIKEKDVCQLFCPLGIEFEELNNTWLAEMNSFGAARGMFAHSSIKTHQPIDPENELNKVKRLLRGLAKLDRRTMNMG